MAESLKVEAWRLIPPASSILCGLLKLFTVIYEVPVEVAHESSSEDGPALVGLASDGSEVKRVFGATAIIDHLVSHYRAAHPPPSKKNMDPDNPPVYYLCGHITRSKHKAVVDEWVKSAIENILPVIEKFIEKDDADFPPEIFIVAKTVWLRDHYTYYGRLTNADFAVFPSVYHFVTHCYAKRKQELFDKMDKFVRLLIWLDKMQNHPAVVKTRELFGIYPFIDIRGTWPMSLTPEEYFKYVVATFQRSIIADKSTRPFIHFANPHTVLAKLRDVNVIYQENNFEYCDLIPWEKLPPSLDPESGQLSDIRATRKRQQIANVVNIAQGLIKDGDTIVDFCGGGGHLALVIAYLFPKVNVILVDRNTVSLAWAKRRLAELQLKNVKIEETDIQNWSSSDFQLGMAIHSCGMLADFVMEKCFAARAGYLVVPCCFGALQNTNAITIPRSKYFRDTLQVTPVEYGSLASMADRGTASWDFTSENYILGKKASGLIDYDRNAKAQEENYTTMQLTMNPETCTPKNDIICGIPRERLTELGLRELSLSELSKKTTKLSSDL